EVTYYLKDYRFYHNRSSYVGFVFFDPQELADTADIAKVEYNKVSSYMGSIRHFLKSLLLAKVYEEDFEIFKLLPVDHFRVRTNVFTEEIDKSIQRVYADSIQRIPLENGNYRIIWPFDTEIQYRGKSWVNNYYSDVYSPVSWFSAPLGYFDI